MDNFLSKNEVVDELWLAYKKTSDYKNGYKDGIPSNNPVIIKQEKEGLKRIIKVFGDRLSNDRNIKEEFVNRTVGDWISIWKKMHSVLFEFVLIESKRGQFRHEEVRFGSPGDEELYKFPNAVDVPRCITNLAYRLNKEYLIESKISNDKKFNILAQFHYEFVRIHPFRDGNGRIARAITDQLAIFFDFPPAMDGFPRHDPKKRSNYHSAIRSCAYNSDCVELARWIGSYIERQLQTLA